MLLEACPPESSFNFSEVPDSACSGDKIFILPENRLFSPNLEHNSLCKNPPSLYWSHRAFHSHTYLSQVSYNVVVKVVAGASHRTAKVDLPFLLAPHSWVNFCFVSVQLLLQSSSSAFYILCARFYFQQQELEETTVQSSNICITQVKENIFIFCFELAVIYCQFLHGKNWAQNMSWIALRQNSNRDLGTAPPCEHSMDWILNPNREFSNILKGWLPRGEY